MGKVIPRKWKVKNGQSGGPSLPLLYPYIRLVPYIRKVQMEMRPVVKCTWYSACRVIIREKTNDCCILSQIIDWLVSIREQFRGLFLFCFFCRSGVGACALRACVRPHCYSSISRQNVAMQGRDESFSTKKMGPRTLCPTKMPFARA